MWLVIGVLGAVCVGGVALAFSGGATTGIEVCNDCTFNMGGGETEMGDILGASGTRFPHGISADSTAPSTGEVRGATLTMTGAATLGGLATLNAGQLRSYTNTTSTIATTQTLVEADILNYDTVLFTPNYGHVTLTFPATSTWTNYIPTAGDMAEQCWYNTTSTASINITFAAGTGMDLQRVATSTMSGPLGILAVPTGQAVCFKFLRQTDTDVSALMTEFADVD